MAAKLWESKVGGFSSAINQSRPEFFGFDDVANPNFVSNSYRGVVLDDAMSGNIGELTYDDIYAAEQDEQAQVMITLLEAANSERKRANEVIERLSAENEQLLSMLAAKGISVGAALDAAGIAPLVLAGGVSERMARDMAAFHGASDLPRFVEPRPDARPEDPLYTRLMGKFNR